MKKHVVISLLLVLGLTMAQADNIFTEDLGLNIPLDSAAVDSEGDELEELDDIDVKASQLPECLAGLFSHDTLILGCDLELLPNKIIVRTKDGDVVYKIAPQFLLDTTSSSITLRQHLPLHLDGRAREPLWHDVRQPQGRCAYPDGRLPSAAPGLRDESVRMASQPHA